MTKTALKLFMLKHSKGGAIVKDDDGNPLTFHDKMIAKASRVGKQVVTYGPDHRKY
jgi:hypothetical protein